MKPEFTASCVRVEDTEEGIGVWLADADPVECDYLALTRDLRPDEQSVRLSLDKVYLERNDQGFSGYGGIEQISLFRDHLHLCLDDKGTRFMGGLSVMKVSFELEASIFQQLREGLAACFDGFGCFHDKADF
ncbi:MAG TPA: Imm10 family immunity protein [Prosthecobacter sp.]